MPWLVDHLPAIQTWLVTTALSVSATLGALGGIYRFFGERFFGHLFDRRLEAFKHSRAVELEAVKHDQNRSIEGLKAVIAHLSDRGKHSNEREYSAISDLWDKSVDLYYATNLCVVSFVQYPALNTMTKE